MGLAVLPARLSKEIAILKEEMLSGGDLRSVPELACHADWAEEVLSAHPEFSCDNAEAILKEEIGKVFLQVLEDAGVFKRTDEGRAAFMRFVDFVK